MTREQINEGNKLIGDFMEQMMLDVNVLYVFSELPIEKYPRKFHYSWDWLMPVIEKIDKLYWRGFPILVNIGSSGAIISINKSSACGAKYVGESEISNTLNFNYFNDYDGAIKITKMEAVYEAVVTFIKWYNQNQ